MVVLCNVKGCYYNNDGYCDNNQGNYFFIKNGYCQWLVNNPNWAKQEVQKQNFSSPEENKKNS